jgi:hypothetical protein
MLSKSLTSQERAGDLEMFLGSTLMAESSVGTENRKAKTTRGALSRSVRVMRSKGDMCTLPHSHSLSSGARLPAAQASSLARARGCHAAAGECTYKEKETLFGFNQITAAP